jgi:hypothetical protein
MRMKEQIRGISPDEAIIVIESREPLGLFLTIEDKKFIAIDNSTGNEWTEEFKDIYKCLDWLEGKYQMGDQQEYYNYVEDQQFSNISSSSFTPIILINVSNNQFNFYSDT